MIPSRKAFQQKIMQINYLLGTIELIICTINTILSHYIHHFWMFYRILNVQFEIIIVFRMSNKTNFITQVSDLG